MVDRPLVLMHPGPEAGSFSGATGLNDAFAAAGDKIEGLRLGSLAKNPNSPIHVHWPEHLVGDVTLPRSVLKFARTLVLLALVRVRRQRVILTMHNLTPHRGLRWHENIAYEYLKSLCTDVVVLYERQAELLSEAGLSHATLHTIPWGSLAPGTPVAGPYPTKPPTAIMLGLIAPYKGQLETVEALSPLLVTGELRLQIVGSCNDLQYLSRLRAVVEDTNAAAAGAIEIMDRFVPESELLGLLGQASFAIGVQVDGLNSGIPFTVLPTGVPVVMADTAQARALRSLYPSWVSIVRNVTETNSWSEALQDLSTAERKGHPPSLSWSPILESHRELYGEPTNRAADSNCWNSTSASTLETESLG